MRYRRSRCLTCYWRDGLFIVHPYPHGTPTSLHPVAVEVCSAFEEWAVPAEAAKVLDHLTPETVQEAVAVLTEAGVLLAEDSPDADRDEEIDRHWAAWSPEASFLHYATQNDYLESPYTRDTLDTPNMPDAPDTRVNDEDPDAAPDATRLPPLFTGYPDAPRLPLPRSRAGLHAPYEQVLHSRRTHRDFSPAPVSMTALATLLSTVFGPVDFIDSGHGALYRRTSPSGGSRQELDAYVGALNVTGLAPGWYHYNCLEHSLELRTEGLLREEAAHLCADQDWAGDTAFLVVLAARLERMSVKYRTPRCYRVCLLNAGHLGQTFALTATALGLGPAQTGAFHDALIAERCLLDNTGHTPLYVLGAGHPSPSAPNEPPPATLTAFTHTPLHATGRPRRDTAG
ncbi:SagB/ThcOx family dehydrogenase [Streptomyces sp. MST-110588]|uniref:SagB/ThcOx family dehydrogenase n=1 Tax=Streptomyces sp. MST-110588 TaxID=2833628 RepID=UPI001F5CDE00|nr:SagB/ThcOx family dehydrogenase [Streptomyces sp. MST-110588]UNO43557.1 SagB/ThcOx family dehydrogenase [Streptomyces sp. MST-110588]